MDQPQELITLTPDQLTEVCVRFAVFMGWTRGWPVVNRSQAERECARAKRRDCRLQIANHLGAANSSERA
jgi:hypothetical protein